ncbi:hypothetical protein Tsubulata_037901 [Turnera subulata]|uniref:Uncharacterized protein n=1 Tax=Turnera subulata TaxID=218843 RepID=A0A9Q0G860_9ROSI|nr:hypothetical protein Tsubulata_037901 [Turnera subulata]
MSSVETSILGRTLVYGVNFPEVKRDPYMHINLERMKANIHQLFAIIQHVFMRASELDGAADLPKEGQDGRGRKAVDGWAETARKSANEAVKAALDFQSKKLDLSFPFDANWRIAPFLRNAIHHIERKHNTIEPKVLEELESIFPHILSKLHLQMWQAFGEYQPGRIDYGLQILDENDPSFLANEL